MAASDENVSLVESDEIQASYQTVSSALCAIDNLKEIDSLEVLLVSYCS